MELIPSTQLLESQLILGGSHPPSSTLKKFTFVYGAHAQEFMKLYQCSNCGTTRHTPNLFEGKPYCRKCYKKVIQKPKGCSIPLGIPPKNRGNYRKSQGLRRIKIWRVVRNKSGEIIEEERIRNRKGRFNRHISLNMKDKLTPQPNH